MEVPERRADGARSRPHRLEAIAFWPLLMQAERLDIMQTSFYKRFEPFKSQLVGLLDLPEEYIEYSIVIRISVAMNILIHWIKNGKRQAPDELADRLEGLMKKMVTLDQLL